MSEIEIYKTASGVQIEIKFEDETVWSTQKQIAEIFQTTPQNITLHLKKIYAIGEVEKISTCKEYLQVQIEGKRSVEKKQIFYNLDVILSVGYRINSIRGTQFRQWATQRLKDYLVQGYAINEKRLKEANTKLQDLQKANSLAAKAGNSENLSSKDAKGILSVLEQYAYALDILDKYDHQNLIIDLPIETEVEVQVNL